jgi:outer membrane protein insertion porin family
LTQCGDASSPSTGTGCNPLYFVRDASGNNTTATTTNAIDPTTGVANDFSNTYQYNFVEEFVGNTWKPRVAVGIGVNWNSPFGPFRIDFAKALLKEEGDDTKTFTFNVGTQF